MEKWRIRFENWEDDTYVDYDYPVFTSDEAENAVRLLRFVLREMSTFRWCIDLFDADGGLVDCWLYDDEIEDV